METNNKIKKYKKKKFLLMKNFNYIKIFNNNKVKYKTKTK